MHAIPVEAPLVGALPPWVAQSWISPSVAGAHKGRPYINCNA